MGLATSKLVPPFNKTRWVQQPPAPGLYEVNFRHLVAVAVFRNVPEDLSHAFHVSNSPGSYLKSYMDEHSTLDTKHPALQKQYTEALWNSASFINTSTSTQQLNELLNFNPPIVVAAGKDVAYSYMITKLKGEVLAVKAQVSTTVLKHVSHEHLERYKHESGDNYILIVVKESSLPELLDQAELQPNQLLFSFAVTETRNQPTLLNKPAPVELTDPNMVDWTKPVDVDKLRTINWSQPCPALQQEIVHKAKRQIAAGFVFPSNVYTLRTAGELTALQAQKLLEDSGVNELHPDAYASRYNEMWRKIQ